MAIYIYQHPDTGETKEIVQSMKEEHTYSEDGVEWQRVWTSPAGFVDTEIDPFNKQQFMDKTNVRGKESIGGRW